MSRAPATAQALAALEQANAVRFARAAIRRELAGADTQAAAYRRAAELLEDPPDVLLAAAVYDVLCWCRSTGRVAAIRHLRTAGTISETRTVSALTDRQRRRLVGLLREVAARQERAHARRCGR